jgi:citrate lyase subunit gamma (acyl carrier protein)
MQIKTVAVCGTLESSDIYVKVEPNEMLIIDIESVVYAQFGEDIRKCILEILDVLSVQNGKITVQDQGALNCVIQARVETAIRRANMEVKL